MHGGQVSQATPEVPRWLGPAARVAHRRSAPVAGFVPADPRSSSPSQDVQVERDWVGDDFVKKIFAELDLAVP